jgi:hypothetical protein
MAGKAERVRGDFGFGALLIFFGAAHVLL